MSKDLTVDEILGFYTDPTSIDFKKFENRVVVDKGFLDKMENLHAGLIEGDRSITADVIQAFIAQYLRSVAEYDAALENIKQAVERVAEAKEKHPDEFKMASDAVAGKTPVSTDDAELQARVNGIISIIRSVHGLVEQLQGAAFSYQHAEKTLTNLAKYL